LALALVLALAQQSMLKDWNGTDDFKLGETEIV
jgi:hypothetical protein